jgi:beta-phosphoglucomutase-like phosphatase (HAD superfamily)
LSWEAFFFDFDGVLADSVEVKTCAFARLFEPYGEEVVLKVVEHHRLHSGVTRRDKLRHYYQEFLGKELAEAELLDLCRSFAQLVVDEVVAAPEILGAEAFLCAWQGKLPFFVVSAAPEEELREIIRRRGWSKYFREITGAPRSKRENLKMLLQNHGLRPDRCLFFGDAVADYQAATACGVSFVGIVPGPEAPLLTTVSGVFWRKDFTEPVLPVIK